MAYPTRSVVYQVERGTERYGDNLLSVTDKIGLIYPSDYAYSTSATDSECDETDGRELEMYKIVRRIVGHIMPRGGNGY